MFPLFRLALVCCAMFVLANCAAAPTGGSAPTAPAGEPAVPVATPQAEGVVVTFRVADVEEYKVRVTDPEAIAVARKLLAGEEAPRIPNGLIVRGSADVNTGYSWHIDPASLEFVEVTIEVCDGLPSDVEQGLLTSERFCPWSAVVVAIDGEAALPAESSAAPLITYRQHGGIAGIDETIRVYSNGLVELQKLAGETTETQLAPADLERLQLLLGSPAFAEVETSYQAPGNDLFTYEIGLPTVEGQRKITTMDGAPHPEVLSDLLAELRALRAKLS